MIRLSFVVAFVAIYVSTVQLGLPAAEHSELWGRQGELWRADGRLPDFSYAGYHRGERGLPTIAVANDVTAFGADGSDDKDDTDAFREAIAATERGAIEVPSGRYIISDIIAIDKPGIVLRGAGPRESVLYFPRDLEDVRSNMGETTSGRPTSNYSWSGGFIWVRGKYDSQPLAAVIEPTVRSERSIAVDRPERFRVGMSIKIELQDDDSLSMMDYLYAGDTGPTAKLKSRHRQTSAVCRVVQVEADRVMFDRPLPFDIRLHWRPKIYRWEAPVSEVGIEQLGFEFPGDDYAGHFTERGANAIALSEVSDCWVRQVRIHNSDSGIFVAGAVLYDRWSRVNVGETARSPTQQYRASWHSGYGG